MIVGAVPHPVDHLAEQTGPHDNRRIPNLHSRRPRRYS